MTTKKDLVEAHSFSRRRLITAFLSGAPGGRQVEPSRPGRTIFGGVALSVLLLAGAAVASVLSPRTPEEWDAQGVVVTEQGTRYVVTKEEEALRPITNLSTAQLIFGLDLEESTTLVSQETVDQQTTGDPIGIQDAPEVLPTPAQFVQSGWTACTAPGAGMTVSLTENPQTVPADGAGFVAEAEGERWLIAEGSVSHDSDQTQLYRTQLDDSDDAIIDQVFNSSPGTITVPQAWLELIEKSERPLGAEGFKVDGAGEPSNLAGESGIPDSARVGDVFSFSGRHYLITDSGWYAMDPFQAQVYLNSGLAEGEVAEADSLPSGGRSDAEMPLTNWPTGLLSDGGTSALCAQLAYDGERTRTHLTLEPGADNWPDSPADVPAAGDVLHRVQPGHGAFFYSGDRATPYIVDGQGTAYLIEGPGTLETLGLTETDAPTLLDTWANVLRRGTALSTELALCPPGSTSTDAAGCGTAP